MMIDPLSRAFLLQQGSCCGSGCTNCPYKQKHRRGATKIRKEETV